MFEKKSLKKEVGRKIFEKEKVEKNALKKKVEKKSLKKKGWKKTRQSLKCKTHAAWSILNQSDNTFMIP